MINLLYLADNQLTVKAHETASVGDTGLINGVTYKIVDKAMLTQMISNKEDITKVVTTFVTDMSKMFSDTNFNQNIGCWDVSNVTNMFGTFHMASAFNQDISNWDTSNVTNMAFMFSNTVIFSQDINTWDTGNVNNMDFMFLNNTIFNQDISNWDVSNVTKMNRMFFHAVSFNQDLSSWDVNGVRYFTEFCDNTPKWKLPKPNFTKCDY